MRRPPLSLAALALALVVLSPAAAQDPTPQTVGDPAQIMDDPSRPHAADLRQGTCDRFGADHHVLPDATFPTGPGEGAAPVTPVLSSVTAVGGRPVEVSIDALLAEAWSVGVRFANDQALLVQGRTVEETYIACGEVGGVRLADGSLALALRQRNGSGYAGVAYLTPDPADPARTHVAVFLVPGAAAAPTSGPTS